MIPIAWMLGGLFLGAGIAGLLGLIMKPPHLGWAAAAGGAVGALAPAAARAVPRSRILLGAIFTGLAAYGLEWAARQLLAPAYPAWAAAPSAWYYASAFAVLAMLGSCVDLIRPWSAGARGALDRAPSGSSLGSD